MVSKRSNHKEIQFWKVFSNGYAVVDHSKDILEFYTFMAFVQNVDKQYLVRISISKIIITCSQKTIWCQSLFLNVFY